MRAAPATAAELTASVDALLSNPAQDDVPDDSGLDDETAAAIERAWAGGSSPALVAAARHELSMQLDGTHAQEALGRETAIFDQVLNEQGGSDGQPDQVS